MKLTENKSSKSLNATLYSPDRSGSNHVKKNLSLCTTETRKGVKRERRENLRRERERERERQRERQRERDREREEGSAGAGLIMSEGIKSSRN